MDDSSASVGADGRPVTYSMPPDLRELSLYDLAAEYRKAMTMVRGRRTDNGWTMGYRPGAELEGLELLSELERQVEKQKAAHVFFSIAEGASWAQVAQRLGVTRQAAQQKYGKNAHGETIEEVARAFRHTRVLNDLQGIKDERPAGCRCQCDHGDGAICLSCGCHCAAADPNVCPCCGADDRTLTGQQN